MYNDYELAKSVDIISVASLLGIQIANNKADCFKGHDTKTPSLTFTPSKGLWHCFGCGSGGSNIELVQEARGGTKREARDWILKQFFGGQPANIPTKTKLREQTPKSIDREQGSSPASPGNSIVFQALLDYCPLSQDDRNILQRKGLNHSVIEHFSLGSLVNARKTWRHLTSRFSIEELDSCGLVRKKGNSNQFMFYKPIILFPFFDQRTITYIQGRCPQKKDPRFLAPKGIKKPLFNINALTNLPLGSELFLCEGLTDTMAAHQLKKNAIGVLGASSFSDDWAQKLYRYSIKIPADNDNAGKVFVEKIGAAFKRYGKSIEVISIGDHKDLCDYLMAKGNN